MPGVDSPRTDHGAFPAKLASPERFQCIFRLGVEYVLHRLPKAGVDKLTGRTDSRATAAGHADSGVRLDREQLVIFFLIKQVQVDPGTGH